MRDLAMVTFDRDGARFTFRVAGVAIHNGRVLLSRAEFDDFWTLPGGRAEMLEASAGTLRREMREEINADVEVGRLLWVVENFFEYGGRQFHELGLYYEMRLALDSPTLMQDEFFGEGDATLDGDGKGKTYRLIFRWQPITALDAAPLYPTFLQEGLQSLPEQAWHVVHHGA